MFYAAGRLLSKDKPFHCGTECKSTTKHQDALSSASGEKQMDKDSEGQVTEHKTIKLQQWVYKGMGKSIRTSTITCKPGFVSPTGGLGASVSAMGEPAPPVPRSAVAAG